MTAYKKGCITFIHNFINNAISNGNYMLAAKISRHASQGESSQQHRHDLCQLLNPNNDNEVSLVNNKFVVKETRYDLLRLMALIINKVTDVKDVKLIQSWLESRDNKLKNNEIDKIQKINNYAIINRLYNYAVKIQCQK